MSLRDIFRSLARRWWLVVVGLLATAGLAAGAVAVTPPSYEGQAYVALIPGEATYPEGGNPFLYLGGGVTMRDILVRVMASEEARERVLAEHPRTGFSVAPDPGGGPLLLVRGMANTPDAALAATAAVLDDLPIMLETLQDGRSVPDGARFSTLVVSQDREASVLRSSTNRALITAVAAGLAATLLVTVWVDAILEGRRRRRDRAAAPVVVDDGLDDARLEDTSSASRR